MHPAWLLSAYQDLRAGVREIPGEKAHPRILAWFEALAPGFTRSDETPNCAAFVGFHLLKAGVGRQDLPENALGARHYLDFGIELPPRYPAQGAVTILKRGGENQPGPDERNALGHVGFFWGHGAPGEALVLGANQGDRVAISAYPLHRLLGLRWPKR